MSDNTCDNCGTETGDLYYNEASGLAYCESCDSDDAIVDDGEQGFHGELREIIEHAEGTDLAGLIPQAQALLALPEESVAALVEAARNMVGAALYGR